MISKMFGNLHNFYKVFLDPNEKKNVNGFFFRVETETHDKMVSIIREN